MISNQPSQPGPEPNTKPADDKPLICVGCKYDLRGTDPAGTCPECGKPVSNSLPKLKPLPEPDPTLPCVGCGYDLRGSDPQGNCPECGESVYKSIRKDSIALADPAWALKVADGCYWLYMSVLLIIPLLIVTLFGPQAVSNFSTAIGYVSLTMVFSLLGHGAFGWLLVKAQTGLSLPEPHRPKPTSAENWRKAIAGTRLACIGFIPLNLGSALIITLMGLIGRPLVNESLSDGMDPITVTLSILLAIQFLVFIIGFAGSARVMADIAMRLETNSGVRQGKSIRVFMNLSLGLTLTAAFCIFLIAALQEYALFACCLLVPAILAGGMVGFISLLQVLFTGWECSKRIKQLVTEEAARQPGQ
jgi:endogenous inhibitor of DNA gyrase (YacG/DUF329 family)